MIQKAMWIFWPAWRAPAARVLAQQVENQGKNIVIIVPDNGMKYLSTPMSGRNDKNTMMRLNFEKIA